MISVVVADLATVHADAVFRPTSDDLMPVSPTAARLDAAAGTELSAGLDSGDRLDIGAAVVTAGGKLSSPFVVHLVIQTKARPVARETIERALVSAWQRANDWALSTVATAPLGVGVGIPLDEAAEIVITSFRQRLSGLDYPKALCIVVSDDAERAQVESMIGGVPS